VAVFGTAGVWAFAAPSSFYARIAHYPPYNRHFLHDLGAFQLGLGVALMLALTPLRAQAVGLWSVAVAAVLHAVSHILDRDLGGRGSDPIVLSLLAAVLVAAAILATRAGREVTVDATASEAGRVRTDPSARTPQQD
jgi:hypothetical protein